MLRKYISQWIKRDPVRFASLHTDMISARIGMTVEQYIWRAIQVSLIAGAAFAALGFVASLSFTLPSLEGRIGITNVFGLQLPALFGSQVPAALIAVVVLAVSFAIGMYLGYALLMRIPGIEKTNRAIKINMTLHNAVAYMYAMRKGGAQLMPIFQSLSERADIYGEVALEFRQIVRDADFFGYDVVTAIRHLSETTPSEKLKLFLEDLLSIIDGGGDMGEFLSMRVRMYQEEARFEQKQFLNVLSLVAEGYVTLFVAGPLFLIIIMVVMGMTGGAAVLQLSLVTYALLPIGSLIFIVLIDLISIKAEKTERYTTIKWLHAYPDITIVKKEDEARQFEQLKKYDRIRTIADHIRHPLESFITNVDHTLYITVPVLGNPPEHRDDVQDRYRDGDV
ncbi:MAG TPA: type II secretion system F family protein [Methanoregula sp.]|nr:type II secretion system F family protein [Methanoregula sp.]